MKYRAVIFDLFGTLVPPFSAAPYERALAEMVAALGVEPRAFHRLWMRDMADARMTGALGSLEAELEYVARALGAGPTPAQLAAAAQVRLAFYRTAMRPRPDAVATLCALKDLGLSTGLISDCSGEAVVLWPDTPFFRLIDAPVFSCIEGLRKPDPRLYRVACRCLGVVPPDCLYVADGFHGELAAARELGMQPVLIAGPEPVSAELAPDEAPGWTGPRIAALSELLGLLAER